MSREGEGDESVKFTIDFDVNDSGIGVGGSAGPKQDLEKLIKKLIREELKKGKLPTRKGAGGIKPGGSVPGYTDAAYERQHLLDMIARRPDSSAKQIKESWAGGRAPSEGDPLAMSKAIMKAAARQKAQTIRSRAAQKAQVQSRVSSGAGQRNFAKFMNNLAPSTGPQMINQSAQARAAIKQQKAIAQQAKNANRAVAAFFRDVDKQQKAAIKARRKSGAFQLPHARGFFDRFTESQNRFESLTRRVRTKAQRLNTYGLFFLETAQVNPIYTAGKFILNTISGLGPHGKAAAFAIAGIASSVLVAQATIKNLSQKGLPLNQDFHRSISDETVYMMTLENQKRRDMGLDGYIATADSGYVPIGDTSVYNSLYARDEIRYNLLTLEEKVRQYN